MKRFRSLALVVVFGLMPMAALSADPLELSVGAVEGAPGQEVEIPISIKGAHDIVAIQARLEYDPAVLEVTKVDHGPAAVKKSQVAGTIEAGQTILGFLADDRAPLNSDGAVFKVLARVKGTAGQKSPLTLATDVTQAWNQLSETPLPMTMHDGSFNVVASSLANQKWWWWIAGAAALVVLALVVWLVRRPRSGKPATRRPSPPTEEDIPTYGVVPNFKHHCSNCQQVIELPGAAIGKPFKCAGCGSAQVGGQ